MVNKHKIDLDFFWKSIKKISKFFQNKIIFLKLKQTHANNLLHKIWKSTTSNAKYTTLLQTKSNTSPSYFFFYILLISLPNNRKCSQLSSTIMNSNPSNQNIPPHFLHHSQLKNKCSNSWKQKCTRTHCNL
jgi:hypothetical protein